MADDKVLELVVYKVKEGTSREEFLTMSSTVSEWIRTQPGFISRDLLYAADQDMWVDVIYWKTLAEAHAAAAAAESHEDCRPFFNLIDMENDLVMLHAEPATTSVVA
jgi:heme-degrading monooxygenase HmoA